MPEMGQPYLLTADLLAPFRWICESGLIGESTQREVFWTMSTAAAIEEAPSSDRKASKSFFWRRLHSLSGVLPIGAFLCYHIFENMSAIRGREPYDEMVNHVNSMLPRQYFYVVELVFIIIPILFHALYGIYIARSGESNASRYPYANNWAYWAQRISGYVALIYLVVHVGVLRFWITLAGNHLAPYAGPGEGKLDLVTYDDVAAHLGNPQLMAVNSPLAGNHIFILYLVGTLVTIYHFTNGLNGFCWTWGIAAGRVAQRRVRAVAWLLFVALAGATLNILFSMRFST
jgi:succinate dehydrogenase / fumarate reductase cytochrome b subunit